jgi:hypothetical protein
MAPSERTPRPGLAKARAAPLVRGRTARLLEARDGAWRLAFERADVVSEGRAEPEPGGLVYYGTTSVILEPHHGASPTAGELEDLAVLAPLDPHLRLRALRIARREAAARVDAPLGPLRAELTVVVGEKGVTIAVDVVAPVVDRKAGAGS